MSGRRSDLALGAAAIAFAGAYLHGTSGITESLLSDSIGAAGLPRAVGWAMGVVGALLCVRALAAARTHAPQAGGEGRSWHPHLRALGLLAILAGYVVLAPWFGYAVATGLLVAASAWYAGAKRDRYLLVVPVAAAAVLWLLFVQAFGIPMPGAALLGH
jgi:hypothetical protein